MMRSLLAMAICLSLATRSHADEAGDWIARAVKATAGSEETIAKRKHMVIKQSGVIYLPNGAAVSTRECTFALPDRAKWVGEMKPPTGAIPFTVVLSGFGGWSKLQGQMADLSPRQFEGMQNETHTLWIAFSLPKASRSLTWTMEQDSKVENRAVRTLKASAAGKAIVTLSIDQQNALVLKVAYSATESGLPVTKEFLFSNHKEFEGQRLPAKVQVLQNGKRIEEWTNDSYRFPAKFDEKEFARP